MCQPSSMRLTATHNCCAFLMVSIFLRGRLERSHGLGKPMNFGNFIFKLRWKPALP